MEVESPIVCFNILFGPKVAILEANQEDIIYQEKDGKCRLKRCEVIDIINISDLPDNLKTGRNSIEFFHMFLNNIEKIEHKQEYFDLIIGNDYKNEYKSEYNLNTENRITLNLYFEKLDKYDPQIEEFLLSKKLYDNAIYYAICKKQYINPIIRDKILDSDYHCRNAEYKYSRYGWAKVFPEDKEEIENLMNSSFDILRYCESMGYKDEEAEKFTEKISKFPFDEFTEIYVKNIGTNNELEKEFLIKSSIESILTYAIRYNKNTKAIRKALKNNYNSEYKDFIDQILDKKEFKDIALSSSEAALLYTLFGGKATKKIKKQIRKSSYCTIKYFMYNKSSLILYKNILIY